MERLTEHRDNGVILVDVAKQKESALHRLASIEDILGDEYDLDRIRELTQADREGRCVVLPAGGFTDKDGENALKSAMNTLYYHNNPVTRYIADAVAEKLTREEAPLEGEQSASARSQQRRKLSRRTNVKTGCGTR